jgi:hypothetical protein
MSRVLTQTAEVFRFELGFQLRRAPTRLHSSRSSQTRTADRRLQWRAMRAEDVQAWAGRWREVAQAEIAELRALPAEVKLRQIDALAQSASLFDWASEDEEDARVRELWMTLRRRSGIR